MALVENDLRQRSVEVSPSLEVETLYTGSVAEVHFTGPRNLDGVGLQMEANITQLRRVGCEPFVFAADEEDAAVPELDYQSPEQIALRERLLDPNPDLSHEGELLQTILQQATVAEGKFSGFLKRNRIPVAHDRNVFSLPELNLGASGGMNQTIKNNPDQFHLIHVHDGNWEGAMAERYRIRYPRIAAYARQVEFPRFPNTRYVAINTLTQQELLRRFGIQAEFVPDGYDFDFKPEQIDDEKFRQLCGLQPHDAPFAVMTRIRPNKGLAGAVQIIETLEKMRPQLEQAPDGLGSMKQPFTRDSKLVLFLVQAKDMDEQYLNQVMEFAHQRGVDLRYIGDKVVADNVYRGEADKMPFMGLYQRMMAILYPPSSEGWGNQAIEAAAEKRPLVMRGYPVALADIFPHVQEIIRMGTVDDIDTSYPKNLGVTREAVVEQATAQLAEVLIDHEMERRMVEHNRSAFRELCDIGKITDRYRRIYAQGLAAITSSNSFQVAKNS